MRQHAHQNKWKQYQPTLRVFRSRLINFVVTPATAGVHDYKHLFYEVAPSLRGVTVARAFPGFI